MATPESSLLAFAAKVLALLDEASYSTTYKFAVLLALIDRSRDGTTGDGSAPTTLEVRSLAERAFELYWPQTADFAGKNGPLLLRQSGTGAAGIVRAVRAFREANRLPAAAPALRARSASGYPPLVRRIEWTLANMPLPRLQKPYQPFMYEIDWDETTPAREYWAQSQRTVRLIDDAGRHLSQLAPLLRPLVERRWAGRVARYNASALDEAYLDRFLFAPVRVPPRKLVTGLSGLQGGKCFYCDATLTKAHIDHFLAWSESLDESIFNYVVACAACNGSKSAHPASAMHLERWLKRFATGPAEQLVALADAHSWDGEATPTLGLARAIYLNLPTGSPLWKKMGEFVPIDAERARIKKLFESSDAA